MLPTSFRLSHRKSFALVFQEGRFDASNEIAIKWRLTHPQHTRVGFIATKKNFKTAVERNRAKRLLREAVRTQLFQLRNGFDIIVLYRYKPKQLLFSTIVSDVTFLLKKNNLLEK